VSTIESDTLVAEVSDADATDETVDTVDTGEAVEVATATDEHNTGDVNPLEVVAAGVPRRRTLPIGGALLTAATLMYFGALFAIYLSERAAHLTRNAASGDGTPWIPSNVRVELAAPTFMAWTMLMSIITMQWAVYAFKRDDRRHGLLALVVQAVFAGGMINQTVFQWNQLGLVGDDLSSAAAPLIYAITGSYVAALVVAMIAFALLAFRTLSGSTTNQHTDGVSAVAVYWYALVVLYFIIWILIFITK